MMFFFLNGKNAQLHLFLLVQVVYDGGNPGMEKVELFFSYSPVLDLGGFLPYQVMRLVLSVWG